MSTATDTGLLHALSFDVEEYFQVANFRQVVRARSLGLHSLAARRRDGPHPVPARPAPRARHVLLAGLGRGASPGARMRRCVDAGHEVASHGYEHLFLQDLGRERFVEDLARTEAALVAAGAPRPIGFRASTFSLSRSTWWAFDVLVERGYRYDSSVHPVSHPTYGVPDFEPALVY